MTTTDIRPGDTVRTKGHWYYKDGTEFAVTRVTERDCTAALCPGHTAHAFGDPKNYGVWTKFLEKVERLEHFKDIATLGEQLGITAPSTRSGFQENADGTLTPRGEMKRTRLIDHIQEQDRIIRRRNATIGRQKAQLAEYAAQLEQATPADELDVLLREFQRRIGEANAAKGFHKEGKALKAGLGAAKRYEAKFSEALKELDVTHAKAAIRNYATARLALITTEVAEAIEELRHGRAVDETHYPTKDGEPGSHYGPHKPEGVPSELADIVIRAFDFAHEFDIDLAAMIDEKLAYNTTRGHRHGKEF